MDNKIAVVNIAEHFDSPWGSTLSFGTFITNALGLAFVVAGVILLSFIIFGGIKIISSAGQGNAQSTSQGKQAVTTAIAGFAIIFVAYWIIRVIEIITNTTFITIPQF